ncbi:D-hexose-6-phosphate mutarotase [Actinomadura macrotermitis]|uniref:Putative glucose-6-phosphate 1-epimerase n=1 Tax=Actinomadura macrotermitis TaxID=2585200 RepID=A0A7K0C3E3_9ACTN|nr:hypothetical protein [Actinomadura macrotermitis]MQY07961.1 putative glucose-6-phosphate 1-epimerase [Actinomadura macrotermitis]
MSEEDLFSLPVTEQLSSTISRRRIGRLPLVVIDHPRVRAAVTLQGAQLIAWQPAGEQPVLWLSEESAFAEGKAVRGGVPICWPWFAGAGEPGHGFARISEWELTSHKEDDETVSLTFTLRSSPRTRELWPHDFVLTARHTLGKECGIELQAEGDHVSTGALHSYFHVGSADEVTVAGLGDRYIDKVIDDSDGRQDGELSFPDRVDRIFFHPEEVSLLKDPVLDRVVEVRHREVSDVVTWNPGVELSHRLDDMADDAYTRFVCVESARLTRQLESAEGAPARFGVTLSVRR